MGIEKDCDCIHHDGAHWIHMNNVSKRMNRQWLQSAIECNGGEINPGIAQGFAVKERARLRELTYQMGVNGVDKIPGDLHEE